MNLINQTLPFNMFWPTFRFPSLLFIFTPCWFEYLCSYGENKEIHRAGKENARQEKKKNREIYFFSEHERKEKLLCELTEARASSDEEGPDAAKRVGGGKTNKGPARP